MCACMYVCMHVCMYIYTHTHIYIYMWVKFANITILSYLFQLSTLFLCTVMSSSPCSPKHPYLVLKNGRNCAQASRRVSVFGGHMHECGNRMYIH